MLKRITSLSILSLVLTASALAQDMPTIADKTEGMEVSEGYFTYYHDTGEGKVYLEIHEKLDMEFLYVNSLAAGVGSNDIGLDRNQLGDSRVVYFERRGPKILLVQPNYSYRAVTNNPKEQQSVRDAFARSVLWGFEVAAEDPGGAILIDLTAFLMRDAHGVANRLRSGGQGSYRLDESRSALYDPGTLNFPQNSEFEVTLTFAGDASGGYIRSVTPTPDAVTVRQHHSFVQLPDDNYEPRVFDPRSGYFATSYQDYSTPIGSSLTKRFITRHRLQKKNPNAKISEPVKPIVYFLDPGTPEPVKSALMEGASWWNQAFEAAGYKNAFRVEVLPDSAHPLDVRYNVINWVHRSTRGWSYGSSVTDPRTGEIIKGHVLLGSLRVRQDYLIAEGLLSPYKDGSLNGDPMLEMALARIRQLSAHEVGHTIGLAHNFAASVNNRASVMDYPAPVVAFKEDSTFDLSQAYDTGIGEWDKVAVRYGYQDFPDRLVENEALDGILNNAIEQGLKFISDSDARPSGGAHPYAHLWDNGKDAVEQLHHIMDVRNKALEQFSKSNIPAGTPMASLEDVLVPIYLFHRYQLDATAKLIGGLHYSYNLRGDSQGGPEPVSPGKQREALKAMLKTLSPDNLIMPDRIIDLLPPRPPGYYSSRELFDSHTDPAFDPLAAAETAANMTVSLLFNPNRAARMVDFAARDSAYMGLNEMIDQVFEKTVKVQTGEDYRGAVQRTINYVVLRHLIDLASDRGASSQVRAIANFKLEQLQEWMKERVTQLSSESNAASLLFGYRILQQYKKSEQVFELSQPVQAPPGSPIGEGRGESALFLECSFRY